MTDRRNRHRFFFWLDADKDGDLLLMEAVDEMKAARSFTSCIRDGLRLVWALRRGDTSVLYELFPWLQDRPTNGNALNLADRDGVLELLREYDEYRQSSAYADYSHNGNGNGGSPKALNAPLVSLPDFDDDDIEIDIHKDTRTDSAANFLKSLEALQG